MHERILQYMPQIAQRGDEKARDSILHILEVAKGVEKKGSALKALSRIASRGDSKAMAAILPFCGGRSRISIWSGRSDRSEEVRSDAIQTLGELCEATDEAAVRLIIEGLGDQWACVISAADTAVRAVAARGTEALKVVVREFLEHQDCRVRQRAFSLARQYIGLADSDIRSCWLRALIDADADVRLGCIQAVTRAVNDAEPRFRRAVLGMLSDKSVFVRFAAVAATVRICDRQDQEAAVAIKQRLQDRESAVRIQAIKGLCVLEMLKHPDTYPAILSRLDDECLGVRHAAASFLGAKWWPSPCMCDFCCDDVFESEEQTSNKVEGMQGDLRTFMEYYEGRHIHNEIDDATIQLVPKANFEHLMFVDTESLEALRKAVDDGSDVPRDLIQRGFWDARRLPDFRRLVAVDMRAVDRSILCKNWEPATLGHALVQARDLFRVCHASDATSSQNNWDISPLELRELAGEVVGQEKFEEEDLEVVEILAEELGEEEMPDEDDIDEDDMDVVDIDLSRQDDDEGNLSDSS